MEARGFIGSLEQNPRAQLFLIDHARQRRIKVWGAACVVNGDETPIDLRYDAGITSNGPVACDSSDLTTVYVKGSSLPSAAPSGARPSA